jgi:hypothetical protein
MSKMTASEAYVKQAEKRLKGLVENIDALRAKQAKKSDPKVEISRQDWDRTLANLEARIADLRRQVAGLQTAGEGQWSDFQARAELGFLNMKTFMQRLTESAELYIVPPLVDEPVVYYLQPVEGGRWALKRHDAAQAAKLFDTKLEGLAYARQYVRGKAPARLIIRRKDGTFQKVHSYEP